MPCITIDYKRMMSEFNTVEKHIHQQSVHSHSLRTAKKKRRAGSSQIYALVLKNKSTDRDSSVHMHLRFTSHCQRGSWEEDELNSQAVEKKTSWTVSNRQKTNAGGKTTKKENEWLCSISPKSISLAFFVKARLAWSHYLQDQTFATFTNEW